MFRQVFQFPLLSRRHLKPVGLVVCLLSFASGCGLANQGLNSKGVQYFQQGRHQEALRTFEEVVTNDPLNTDGHYNLAATYHRLALEKQDSKLLAQSEQLYRQCLHLDSNNADGYRGLAVLMMQSGRREQAYQLLEDWASKAPGSAEPQVELARLYDEGDQLDEAELHLQKALSVDSNNPRAWTALAHLRERDGDMPNALAHYQRSYILDNRQPLVATRIASINRSLRLDQDGSRTRMVDAGDEFVR